MKEKFSLKDFLFNEKKLRKIAAEINSVYKDFEEEKFIHDCLKEFPKLELKQRIRCICQTLHNYLPTNYRRSTNILLKSLPLPNDESKTDNDFGDFIYAPYADFIAVYGCEESNLDFSLHALKEITKRFSAEDAIRYFINLFPRETLAELLKWCRDKNYHVRRLCSEGTRPKLPWAQKISLPVEAAIPILDSLYSDNTRYVTRSVANHMNDISKIDPSLVIQTLRCWKESGRQDATEMEYIVKHSLRTLIKNGDKEALKLIGITHKFTLKVKNFSLNKEKLKIGERLEFYGLMEAGLSGDALVDYIIWFKGKNNKLSKKVFKFGKFKLKAGESVLIKKKYYLRAGMTTRKLYPGKHVLALQVNGKIIGEKNFILTD